MIADTVSFIYVVFTSLWINFMKSEFDSVFPGTSALIILDNVHCTSFCNYILNLVILNCNILIFFANVYKYIHHNVIYN